jgi:hypothetical protein
MDEITHSQQSKSWRYVHRELLSTGPHSMCFVWLKHRYHQEDLPLQGIQVVILHRIDGPPQAWRKAWRKAAKVMMEAYTSTSAVLSGNIKTRPDTCIMSCLVRVFTSSELSILQPHAKLLCHLTSVLFLCLIR